MGSPIMGSKKVVKALTPKITPGIPSLHGDPMYPGGTKGFYDKPIKNKPSKPIKKPIQPIARNVGGIIGRGGKMVDDIYNTY